jgi:hypothetical protein
LFLAQVSILGLQMILGLLGRQRIVQKEIELTFSEDLKIMKNSLHSLHSSLHFRSSKVFLATIVNTVFDVLLELLWPFLEISLFRNSD